MKLCKYYELKQKRDEIVKTIHAYEFIESKMGKEVDPERTLELHHAYQSISSEMAQVRRSPNYK